MRFFWGLLIALLWPLTGFSVSPGENPALNLKGLEQAGSRLLPLGHEFLAVESADFSGQGAFGLLVVSQHIYEKQTMDAVTRGKETDMVIALEGRRDHLFSLWPLVKTSGYTFSRKESELRGWSFVTSKNQPPVLYLTLPAGILPLTFTGFEAKSGAPLSLGLIQDAKGWANLPQVIQNQRSTPKLIVLPGQRDLVFSPLDGANNDLSQAQWSLPMSTPFQTSGDTEAKSIHGLLLPWQETKSHQGKEVLIFASQKKILGYSLTGQQVFSWPLSQLLSPGATLLDVVDMDQDGNLDLVFQDAPPEDLKKNSKDESLSGGWLDPDKKETIHTWHFPGYPVFLSLDSKPGLDAQVFQFDVGFWGMLKAMATRTLSAKLVVTRWTQAQFNVPFSPVAKEKIKVKVKLSRLNAPLSLTARVDLNGDNLPDLLWIDLKDKAHFRPGQANGSLGKEIKIRLKLPKGADLGNLKIRDLNGDNRLDLVVPFEREDGRMGVSWFLDQSGSQGL